MPTFQPPTVTIPQTDADDPRIGHLIGRSIVDPRAARAVLVGFASDEGEGADAAHAPDAIRQALYAMTPDARVHDAFVELVEQTVDLGNLVLEGSVEEQQERLGVALAPYLHQGTVPVMLGGSRETTYGHFLGYVQEALPVALLNWDARAGVEALAAGKGHAGSVFRQVLEHPTGLCTAYMVAGLQPHRTARAHLDMLHGHFGRYFWREDITPGLINVIYAQDADALLVTFNLQAVNQAAASGVRAPSVDGMDPALWFKAAYEAGRCPRVTSIDIVDDKPTVVGLAALTVWHVLRGLAEREIMA